MLVGRDSECRAIDALLDAARDSRSGALVLRGEAGIGKSALLTHAVQHADGMRVLTGVGVEAESELPFAGMHQLLWPVLDRAEALPAVQAAALRGAFGLSADRVDDRFLVSVALLGVLTAVADDEPLLCVVDDAHWLDSASAEALVFVARRLQADPVALLIAAREGEARRFEAPGLPELALGGLDERDALALLDAGAELPAAVRDELVRATGGNPLALHELPAALTADQRAGRAPLDLSRELQAIDGVDDVEERERVLHLVGLQVTDEMPRHRPPERRDLRLRFLHAILAERAHARPDGDRPQQANQLTLIASEPQRYQQHEGRAQQPPHEAQRIVLKIRCQQRRHEGDENQSKRWQ
jgi:hypothetical protein